MAEIEELKARMIAAITRLKRVEEAAQAVVHDYYYGGGDYESLRMEELKAALEGRSQYD